MSQAMKMIVALTLVVGATTEAVAQSVFIGPRIDYAVSTSVPQEVSQSGAPVRVNLGLGATIPIKSKLDLRFAALYRIENAGITSGYVPTSRVGEHSGTIDVVDPGTGGPQVLSDIKTTSFEFQAALYFPVADLDTSGAKLSLGIGAFADALLGGTQVDDYSTVPDLGDSTASFTYASQIGFGALLGLGVTFPVGSGQITFDFQYAFREPNEVEIENTNPVQQTPIGWLIGRGIRLGLGYQFGL